MEEVEEYRKRFHIDFYDPELYIQINNGEEIDNKYDKLDNKLDNKPGLHIWFNDSNLDDKLPRVPEHIKYIVLICEPIHYADIPKLLLSSSLEFVKIRMPLSGIFNHNMLDYIKLSKSLKALSLILYNDDPNADAKKIQDAVDLIIKKSIIPCDIENLLINFYLPNINEYKNLKTLEISGFKNEEYNYSLDNLPESLEWLEIHPIGFNQPVNNLPSNLKVLIFGKNRLENNYHNGYKHLLTNLPYSLEILLLPELLILDKNTKVDETCNLSIQSIFENLPPNLRILRLPQYMPDNINYNLLPDSIEIIMWFWFEKCYKEIFRFPTSLKKIQIAYDNRKLEQYFSNASFIIEVLYSRRKLLSN
jgi:hypothetical protein